MGNFTENHSAQHYKAYCFSMISNDLAVVEAHASDRLGKGLSEDPFYGSCHKYILYVYATVNLRKSEIDQAADED